jgi:PEP-CTERM motif
MKQIALTLVLALTSLSAWSGNGTAPPTVPEPDALALFAIGAVGGLVMWARNRKKK